MPMASSFLRFPCWACGDAVTENTKTSALKIANFLIPETPEKSSHWSWRRASSHLHHAPERIGGRMHVVVLQALPVVGDVNQLAAHVVGPLRSQKQSELNLFFR